MLNLDESDYFRIANLLDSILMAGSERKHKQEPSKNLRVASAAVLPPQFNSSDSPTLGDCV